VVDFLKEVVLEIGEDLREEVLTEVDQGLIENA